MSARCGRRAVLGGIVGAVAAGLVAAGCAADERRLRVAAGDPGGIYAAFGGLLAPRLEARVGGLRVEVQQTAGSVDNLGRLRAGEADVGLALADSIGAAEAGAGVLALARTYENYLQLLVRVDSGIEELAELRGRAVVLGAAGSGAALSGAVLLRAAGLGAGAVEVRHASLGDSLAALGAGEVAAVLWSGGLPTPAVAALHRDRPLRMIDLGDRVAAMRSLSGYEYRARRVPEVGYGGGAARTVGVPNLLLARPGLPGDLAGAVVETLTRDAAALVPEYALGVQYLAPPTMIRTGAVDLHPGAVAAYRRLHG
ncbi:TAXI family TRAP transporter solute-binding subunit [Nocardioides ferulae]|uniref:TAXI family TRAP transporter solute-binding subunit n=1 Tax=Nocardioides ferulae TaxID=2340821 RepID=UPI000EB16F63|nr:TAXI family TRAP transporter solute-binding subunit [Nocardioides ferulae]